jgi:hypothetical protein
MLRCREVVPRIAAGVVQALRKSRAIAIDDGQRDITELLVASALVDTLTRTQGAADMKALSESVANAFRKGLTRGTLYAKGNDLRDQVEPLIRRFENIDTAQDASIRGTLDVLQEGTPEWEEAYAKRAAALAP